MSGRGRVSPPSSPSGPSSGPSSRPASQPNTRTPPPAPPLIAPTGSPTLDCMADAINSAVAPFQNAPPPEQGAAGWVAQGLGGVVGLIGAPQQLIDNAFAGLTAPIAAMFPAMPAVTLLGMHIGMLHTHTHPPSLIPPAPPVPLPSIGMLVGAGSMAVLGCGMPLARAGDMGISVTCGSLAPPFEVFTGSSNVFVGGARAARVLDITKHCDPTTMGPFGIAMAVAGVAAGAAGAIATNAAAQAAQAAADAAVLALKLLAGKDPGLPPGIGALVGPPLPNVLIGGFPCPPIGDMVIGALMKGLKRLAQAVKKLRSSRRANGHCANGSHPIYLVTGENFDHFTDFVSPGLFRWQRYYTTAHARIDGPLGLGFRHCYQRHLDVRLHQATFIDWDGVELEFPKFEAGSSTLLEHGYVLRRVSASRYELSTRGEPTMVFEGDRFTEILPLVAMYDAWRVLEFEYDQDGRLTEVVDRMLDGRDTQRYRLAYDPNSRITAIHHLGSTPAPCFAASYSRSGELVQARDACNGVWTYEYDTAHRWTAQTDPRGYTYSFRYDDEGRCIWASGQDGLWEAHMVYDPAQRCTTCTEGDGGPWLYHYDNEGFITKIVNPEGGERLRIRDQAGRIIKDVDAGGRTLVFLYDRNDACYGRLDRFGHVHPPEHIEPRLDDPFERALPSTALARVFARVVEPKPAARHGAGGRLLALPAELRGLAHQVFWLRGLSVGASNSETRVWRDALGRVACEIDDANRIQRHQFDATGNEIAQLDRDGRVHRWTTSRWNLIGERIDPLGNKTQYRYSNVEQLTSLIDPLGNETRWVYDRCERLREVWRHGQRRDIYEYDDQDHFTAKYHGDGQLLFRNVEFHANHLVSRRALEIGGEHHFDYDPSGRIIEASTERDEVKMAHTYEGRRAFDLCNGEGVRRWLGEHTERIEVLGRFSWRLVERSDVIQLWSPVGGLTQIEQDWDGIVLRSCVSGTREWLQYDQDGRLLGRLSTQRDVNPDAHHLGWGVKYTYSPEGDLLSRFDSGRGTSHYEVDAAHRLIAEIDPGGQRSTFVHDAADNLVHQPGLSRLEIGQGNLALATATELFEYDNRHRLATRRCRDGGMTSYAYDSFDMLIRVELSDAEPWIARYDAIGRRLSCGSAGREHTFHWDGDRLAADIDPGGRLRIYLYASHDALVPLGFVDYASVDSDPADGQEYSVMCDTTGMPLHIEDAHGRIVWRARRISPFGQVAVDPASTIDFRLRWPGHYADTEIGLHYNRWRYYDPALGRYLQPDPIGYRGSEVNLYAYCPNPLVQIDVLGLAGHGKKGPRSNSETPTTPPSGQDAPVVLTQRQARTADSTGYYVADDGTVRRAPANYVAEAPPPRSNAERAADLGYDRRIPPQRAPFDSHGQEVFFNGHNYITPDVDGHNVSNGWKMFSRRGERTGTHDADLNRIKD